MKKGQITLYVVIAILVVAAIGSVVYLQQTTNLLAPGDNINPIRLHIDSCLEKTGQDALMIIGLQGGYNNPPAISTGTVPYYYFAGKFFIPQKNIIEKELASYVSDNLDFCLNFSKFPEFEIIKGKINSSASILDDSVRFEINYPITLQGVSSTTTLSRFSTNIPSRLSTIYKVAASILTEQTVNNQICISCIIDEANENNLYVSMENYGNTTVIFSIQDSKVPLISGQAYEFNFAEKF